MRFIVLSLAHGRLDETPAHIGGSFVSATRNGTKKGMLDLAGDREEMGNPKIDMAAALNPGTKRLLRIGPVSSQESRHRCKDTIGRSTESSAAQGLSSKTTAPFKLMEPRRMQ